MYYITELVMEVSTKMYEKTRCPGLKKIKLMKIVQKINLFQIITNIKQY